MSAIIIKGCILNYYKSTKLGQQVWFHNNRRLKKKKSLMKKKKLI